MYKHILLPTDGSKLALKAVKEAAGLARNMKAKVTAVYVIPPYIPAIPGESALLMTQTSNQLEYRKASEQQAGEALGKVQKALAAAKIRCETVSLTDAAPWHGILEAAKAKKCDVIVMASHGRSGLAGMLLGSETAKVLSHSKKPVLVCR